MHLQKLKLINYRNYENFEGCFDHLKTIIIGQNAQGKTNILEAINILATSQSDRAEKDNDLVYWNKEHSLIFATIQTTGGTGCAALSEPRPPHRDVESRLGLWRDMHPLEIALQINPAGRRKLKINDVAKKAPQADLLGNFFAVMFSCDDLYLIKGSPSVRRNWLDSVIFQLNSKYHKTMQDYQKLITQKNALLKSARETGISKKTLKEQLEIWNDQIINSGSEIISTRLNFIEDIKPIAKDFQENISKHTESLDLIYKSTVSSEGNVPGPHFQEPRLLRETFKKALDRSLDEELGRGQSVIGPHRDDLSFLINEKEAKSFASQGQQRSIVLAVKLAELKVIENRKGEIPVLLLDDVFAELDESRQDFLLHNLPENIQIFLTTTHLSGIQKEFLQGAQILEIKNGQVIGTNPVGADTLVCP